jgi:hypothetical protein
MVTNLNFILLFATYNLFFLQNILLSLVKIKIVVMRNQR